MKRIERLFCRNERAAITTRLVPGGRRVVMVAVAAILVAGIRLTFLDTVAALRRGGTRRLDMTAPFARGAEMGWFEHGSTILLLAPAGAVPVPGIVDGARIRAGAALLALPA